MKREVMVYELKVVDGHKGLARVEKCEAHFHAWGVDYEEFENGPAQYSIAIIEYPDGEVASVPVENIKFLDRGKPEAI